MPKNKAAQSLARARWAAKTDAEKSEAGKHAAKNRWADKTEAEKKAHMEMMRGKRKCEAEKEAG